MTNTTELRKELLNYWKTDKMADYCLKKCEYIEMDEHFVEICDKKPRIDKTIYYCDESKNPGNSRENFLAYNNRNKPDKFENDGFRKHYLAIHYIEQPNDKLTKIYCHDSLRDGNLPDNVIRELTDDELNTINKAIDKVAEDYDKRLNQYYNRYSDQVYCIGYWSNR